ncbi:nuclear-pore anchor-like [Silene latifolia]|uniref:nuclear-pore anchor-like n=1 Tax=Silene latifolia TaxID=37657 RepID=UPI003D77E3C2
MPSFISDEEFAIVLAAGDVTAVAEKADAFIQTLNSDIETAKAKADAASITAEQTCSILEQKFISLSSEFSAVESRNLQLEGDLQQRSSELAQVQSEKHQLYLKFIEKDGEIERLKTEVSEVQKSKRQLLELLGVKDAEINEKNSTIKSYVDKISDLTDRAAKREARVSEVEAELLRCRAHCEKSLQEKELFEKHNAWLNAELTAKVDSFLEQRKKSAEFEADMSAKLADIEKQYNECSSSLSWHKERVRELELRLESLQRELCLAKDDASAVEQRYSAEISTVSKLVDLYKESSEEWSRKAGELEGVIKALETQLSQTESDYKDKCEKEAAARREAEKETLNLTEKVSKLEAELEYSRRASELDMFPLSSFTTDTLTSTAKASDLAVVPHVASGVSGTALAASLLREGWSLAKMYANYQEAADALRHEQMGRKQIEATLERILVEIEEKASILLDERAEHERLAEAYALMNQKLQQSLSEKGTLEKVIRELKAEVKKCEREHSYAQKEIIDLQNQVTILLKECRDVQLRCGSVNQQYMDDDITISLTEVNDESDIQKVISEHLVSVKDIKALVEQNAKLRNLVRSLSDEVQIREMQVKEQFGEELQKHKEEAASRVAAVLERAEEQGKMIESLHSSVSMFKRLFEEEHRLRSSGSQTAVAPPANEGKDFMLLLERSQETAKQLQEQASERVRCLEDELASLKTEIISLRSERDKLALEANFAQEKLERFVKEFNHQREESNGILVRNIEFSQIIVNYQKKLRENSESVHSAEELTRKLNMELAVLRREKELLLNSEKRAQDEVLDLSQRVYRLQASLDTVLSTEQVREEARAEERRKSEEHISQIERQLAEAQNELQEERNNVRTLSHNHELTVKDAMRQVEDMGKRLEVALQAVIAADRRAAAAEAKYSDLERNLKLAEANMDGQDRVLNLSASASEGTGDLTMANQEIERLKSEALASKNHMEQYKSIAQVNEGALKQIESAHEGFKLEAEQLKMSLESEIKSLRDRVLELENESSLKWKEAASAASQKDEALASAMAEITALKEEASNKVAQFVAMEVQVSVLNEDLERAHQRAHAVQANYERQVILQAETIQELTKTSQALALVQEEASELRRTAEAYKSENIELKAKWVVEKSELEKSKNEAEKKYDEINDQNKVLHNQLEALHLKLTEKERGAAGIASASTSNDSQSEAGLHSVVSYLRRSREIAETEISLLKQEKLRLQSHLEKALKAAEASLSAERENSRSLFTEDEFKALKLQVSEINLLRESNMQLREENRHNFEECQKLREAAQIAKVEAEKLQNILKEREHEIECFRKEIELYKKEKERLERRISDMLEASNKVNLEDYNLLKSEVEELKDSVREKEAVIADTSKIMSQKQELMAKLEQDLGRTKLELSERDGHVAQVEALKLDVDKQKKINIALKRRTEVFSRDKETLSKQKDVLLKEKDTLINEKEVLGKEKDALLKEKEFLGKEKDGLLKEKEVLLKENEALSKEKQATLKQLEDLRGEKKATLDTSVDLANSRIKLLESTVSKQRKEKEKRLSIEKLIIAKVENVDTERKKFQHELEKQKEAARKISEELEKLKHARDSLPEGTSVVHLLSGNSLDDLASAYVLAIEKFEREAHLVLNEVANQGSVGNSSAMDATPVVVSTVQVAVVETPVTKPSTAPPTCPPAKTIEESETKVSMLKARKLVRPRLPKSGEPSRNVEMSDSEGSKTAGNASSMQEMAIQSTVTVSSEHPSRKRPLSPSPSDPQEEQLQVGDPTHPSTVVQEPILKKSKGLDSLNDEVHGQTTAPANVETILTIGQLLDAVRNVPQGLANSTSDFGKDVETAEGLGDEGRESEQPDDAKTLDIEKDNIADNDYADKEDAVEQMVNEASDLLADQDDQQPMMDDTTIIESRDAMDAHPEQFTTSSMPSPSQVHDAREMISSEISNANEHIEEGELAEDVTDVQDKSINGEEGTAGDVNNTCKAISGVAEGTMSTTESVLSRENSSNVESGQDLEQPSQALGTINIADRARARAAARLGQNSPASTSASASVSASPPPVRTIRRGRGGAMARNRGRRGGRQG